MRRRPPTPTTATAVIMIAALVVSGCEALVWGKPPANADQPQVTIVVPRGTAAPLPGFPHGAAVATFDGLDARTKEATAEAAKSGADLKAVVLDRHTGQLISNGDNSPIPIASVAKLFIADDLLMQESQGQTQLSSADRIALDVMLRASDDNAAESFWNRSGGSAVVSRIAERYGLKGTTTPYDGNWYNTLSTASDLVRYYDMLLDGSGGLPPEKANVIISNLAQSTPIGVDGYPQRFGIPEGLFAEQVAVKQGWMCCWDGANWMHLSTGVIGANRRYVIAIGSLEPNEDSAARATITQAVKTMFPGGKI